jgi:hypothetical protein
LEAIVSAMLCRGSECSSSNMMATERSTIVGKFSTSVVDETVSARSGMVSISMTLRVESVRVRNWVLVGVAILQFFPLNKRTNLAGNLG